MNTVKHNVANKSSNSSLIANSRYEQVLLIINPIPCISLYVAYKLLLSKAGCSDLNISCIYIVLSYLDKHSVCLRPPEPRLACSPSGAAICGWFARRRAWKSRKAEASSTSQLDWLLKTAYEYSSSSSSHTDNKQKKLLTGYQTNYRILKNNIPF